MHTLPKGLVIFLILFSIPTVQAENQLYSALQRNQYFIPVAVFDGDTLLIQAKHRKERLKIRLVGIDAPEMGIDSRPGQPFSRRAKKYLEEWVKDRELTLVVHGKDRYHRTLAEVFIRGKNINLELVKKGLAEVYSGPPPPRFNPASYLWAQGQAKKKKKGIWSLESAYESPWKWRKKHPRQ